MAGLSQISGLVAKFDVKGAVEELLGPRKAEIGALRQARDEVQQRQDALRTLNARLLDLRHAAQALADASSFFSYTASLTTNSNVPASQLVEVTGTDAVNAGTHTLVVRQLAQALRLGSSAAVTTAGGAAPASDAQPLGMSGTFQVNGRTVQVNAADALRDIARKVNDLGAGVTATVVKVQAGDFRLVLTSDTTGAQGFTLSGADLDAAGPLAGLNLGGAAQANARQVLQQAQDAVVVLDGLTVSRAANRITDLLPGVTLDLRGADPNTTITMSVGVDRAAIRAKAQAFVDAYNKVADFLNEQFRFDAHTGKGGVLAGSALLTSIQGELSSALLAEVPGLAADRNSLVKIGIEPDAHGRLVINDTRFSRFLNDDPGAIRDVLAASGTSDTPALSFLTPGFATTSGSYAVNVTQAAARAEVAGTANLTAGLAQAETVQITETGTGRVASVALTAGMTRDQIVQALNDEFARTYTERHRLSQALTAAGSPATAATTFAALGAGVAAGDTIAIAGTDHAGRAVSSTFTIQNPNTTTLGDLLHAIELAFGHGVTAAIDAAGHVTITDVTAGDSRLSLTLTARNEGGGTLGFGSDVILQDGRGPLALEALPQGAGILVRTKHYGSSQGFSISQTVDGLGIPNQTVQGADVAGTIQGYPATGRGQLLTGTAGPVDGMSVRYTGAATGAAGTITVRMGTAAALAQGLDVFSNPFTGLVQHAIESEQSVSDTMQQRIQDLEHQLEMKRRELLQSFTRMEKAMAVLNAAGSYLTQQIQAMNKPGN